MRLPDRKDLMNATLAGGLLLSACSGNPVSERKKGASQPTPIASMYNNNQSFSLREAASGVQKPGDLKSFSFREGGISVPDTNIFLFDKNPWPGVGIRYSAKGMRELSDFFDLERFSRILVVYDSRLQLSSISTRPESKVCQGSMEFAYLASLDQTTKSFVNSDTDEQRNKIWNARNAVYFWGLAARLALSTIAYEQDCLLIVNSNIELSINEIQFKQALKHSLPFWIDATPGSLPTNIGSQAPGY